MPDKYVLDLGFGNVASPDPSTNLPNVNVDATLKNGVVQYISNSDIPEDHLGIAPLVGPAIINVEVRVIAYNITTGPAGSWRRGITVKWDAALAATVVGTEYDCGGGEQGASGYSVSLIVDLGTIVLRAVGSAVDQVYWFIEYKIFALETIT